LLSTGEAPLFNLLIWGKPLSQEHEVKILEILLSRMVCNIFRYLELHGRGSRATDGQTDRQTDRQTGRTAFSNTALNTR